MRTVFFVAVFMGLGRMVVKLPVGFLGGAEGLGGQQEKQGVTQRDSKEKQGCFEQHELFKSMVLKYLWACRTPPKVKPLVTADNGDIHI